MGFFGKRSRTAASTNQKIIDTLEMLARAEQRIARFYHLCSETRQEETEFWKTMAASERRHVEYLHHMRKIYEQNPHQFQPDYPFDIAAIRLFEFSLRDLPGRSQLEQIGREELLQIVEGIENSAVEMNYGKVIKSQNEDFNRLAAKLQTESEEHQRAISTLASDT